MHNIVRILELVYCINMEENTIKKIFRITWLIFLLISCNSNISGSVISDLIEENKLLKIEVELSHNRGTFEIDKSRHDDYLDLFRSIIIENMDESNESIYGSAYVVKVYFENGSIIQYMSGDSIIIFDEQKLSIKDYSLFNEKMDKLVGDIDC